MFDVEATQDRAGTRLDPSISDRFLTLFAHLNAHELALHVIDILDFLCLCFHTVVFFLFLFGVLLQLCSFLGNVALVFFAIIKIGYTGHPSFALGQNAYYKSTTSMKTNKIVAYTCIVSTKNDIHVLFH